MFGGERLGEDRFAIAEVAQGRRAALLPFDFDRLADVRRGGADLRCGPPSEQLRFGRAHRGDEIHAGHPARRGRRAGRDRREAVAVLDHQPTLEVFVDDLGDRALQTSGEDGDEGDQGEADHQGRRGDGGAARVALRVLPRQAPGEAAEALQRPAGDHRQRRHQAGAEERNAEHDRHRAGADQAGPGAPFTAPEQAHEDDRQTDKAEQDREPRVEEAPAPAARWGVGLEGGDRRHPGRAQRRNHRRDEGDDRADQQRDDDRAALHHQGGGRQVEPDRLEERLEQKGDRRSHPRCRRSRPAGRSRRPRSPPRRGSGGERRRACAAARTRRPAGRR